MKPTIRLFVFLLLPHLNFAQVSLDYPKTIRGMELSMTKVKEALTNTGYTYEKYKNPPTHFFKVLIDPNRNIKPEGYKLEKKDKQITIYARDASGARYGALAFAEQLSSKKVWDKINPQSVDPTFA